MAYRLAHRSSENVALHEMQAELHELTTQVEQLKHEQALPGLVWNRYRGSVGYIYGVYHVGFGTQRPELRVRISGTGFLVGDDLIVTNRHVAEPWYGDENAKRLIDRGATATLETLEIFFPSAPKPLRLFRASISNTSDLAVLRTEDSDLVRKLPVLPLADSPGPAGQLVTVIGYPLGIAGMLARSPSGSLETLASRRDDLKAVGKLAAMSLIRPSATYGHLSDLIGDKIVYDAPSAHGGSGGPVLNAKGEVIGVNFAYMDGFSGNTLGISVEAVRPMVKDAQTARPAVPNRIHENKVPALKP